MSGSSNGVTYNIGVRVEESTVQSIAIMQRKATGLGIMNISGSPEGVYEANIGSIACDRTNGTAYIKNTGTGDTGWVALASGSGTVTSVTGTASRVSSTGGLTPVIDIDSAYVGQTSITTLGTIGAGTWEGTTIALADGGTGSTAFTAGSIVFSNGSILTQDNASLFFDDTNNRLGIGITTPLDTLHIVGAIELDHTATENDDHGIEIVCDANGFADVKALDIDYITGTLAAGQDEEAILVNIDESSSTGGIMAGYLVLATAEGSATINGYETGINVNPVVHQSGTFGDADNILNKAVDVTTALASGGAGAISIFVDDNDTLTIGDAAQWGEHEIILATGASGGGVSPNFEYSTGGAAFSAFVPADGTNGFRNSGAILWDASALAGWVTATSGLYEVRITRTRNSLSTTPIIDELQISALTEYKWDKNGAVNLASLTLATDLAVAEGGTGASTLTGVLTGNGTSAITANAVTQYGVLVGGASNAVASTAVGTANDVLTSNGAGVAPTYQTPTAGTVTSVSGTSNRVSSTGGATPVIDIDAAYVGQASITTLGTITTGVWGATDVTVANGGTGLSATTAYAVLCGGTTTTAALQSIASVGTSGQVLTSNGAAALPTMQDAAGGGLTWSVETGTSASLVEGTGIAANNASLVTLTLPTTAAIGDTIAVTAMGAGFVKIAQNASQLIHLGTSTTTTGTGGSLTATAQWDYLEFVCIVTNTTWFCKPPQGSWTVV